MPSKANVIVLHRVYLKMKDEQRHKQLLIFTLIFVFEHITPVTYYSLICYSLINVSLILKYP
jgi:hypothetical protein